MTVYIEKARPNSQYSWLVYKNNTVLKGYYKKEPAKRKARSRARNDGDVLKEQMTDGSWRTIRRY